MRTGAYLVWPDRLKKSVWRGGAAAAQKRARHDTSMYDSLKNPQNYIKNFGIKIFFERKFFRPKIIEKPLFLAIFGHKFDKSSESAELN